MQSQLYTLDTYDGRDDLSLQYSIRSDKWMSCGDMIILEGEQPYIKPICLISIKIENSVIAVNNFQPKRWC